MHSDGYTEALMMPLYNPGEVTFGALQMNFLVDRVLPLMMPLYNPGEVTFGALQMNFLVDRVLPRPF